MELFSACDDPDITRAEIHNRGFNSIIITPITHKLPGFSGSYYKNNAQPRLTPTQLINISIFSNNLLKGLFCHWTFRKLRKHDHSDDSASFVCALVSDPWLISEPQQHLLEL